MPDNSEIETESKTGYVASQYANARITVRFKKGTNFRPVADVIFGIEFDQTTEAFVWRVSRVPGARYQRLDDMIWREFKTLGPRLSASAP
jgi:hypothetical protein